jgi:uncharacterized protein with PIN domain
MILFSWQDKARSIRSYKDSIFLEGASHWLGRALSFCLSSDTKSFHELQRRRQMILRSNLNPEEQSNQVIGPTRLRKGMNQSELACRACGNLYFVDDISFNDAMSAMEMGLESSFYCDECEVELEELAH